VTLEENTDRTRILFKKKGSNWAHLERKEFERGSN